jgi:predicted phosphodiesterase
VPGPLTRILSDIHYGDRASRVARLAQIRPLLDGAGHLVLNGDTLDTRPGPHPQHTAACRAEVLDFFGREVASVTFLTGNHDADFSPHHRLDLAEGRVFAIHGDVIYDDAVPWSKDAPLIRRRLAEEMRAATPRLHDALDHRLALLRRVTGAIPQRHQSERNPIKHAVGFLTDVCWPPWWILRVLRAWQRAPILAAELAQRHRPQAKFILVGHTHRPGIWRLPTGVTVINTGSYCPPLGRLAVDLTEDSVVVREVEFRGGEFRLREVHAEFPLASRGGFTEIRA